LSAAQLRSRELSRAARGLLRLGRGL
jgi:hypothetical protein